MMDTGLAWYQLAVTDVSDTNVALDMTIGFANGTEVKMNAGGDLATGRGNQTFFIFPTGLSKGGTMPTGQHTIPRADLSRWRQALTGFGWWVVGGRLPQRIPRLGG